MPDTRVFNLVSWHDIVCKLIKKFQISSITFGDIAEDETNDDVEDDMADFIVDDEDVIYGKGDSLRYFPYTQFFQWFTILMS